MAEEVQTPPSRTVAIAQMMCAGATQQEIADKLGVHRHTIAKAMDTPEVLEEVERITNDARKAARRYGGALVGKAAKVWDEALTATTGETCAKCGVPIPDHAIRLRAADSVADRFGLPKSEVQEVVASLSLAEKSDAEIEREVLSEAAAILDRLGKHQLAAEVRTCS